MRFPSQIAVPVLAALATLTICSLGVRRELQIAKDSIADHRRQVQLAQRASKSNKATHDEPLSNVSSP